MHTCSTPSYASSRTLKGMSSAESELNMVTRMGSTAKVADFVTVAKWFAEQDLAHVPTSAARQTTFREPRSKPAVDSSVSAATRLRTSTTSEGRLTRVSDAPPSSLTSVQSRTSGQATQTWAGRVDFDAIRWSDVPYHRYHAHLLCRNLQSAVTNDSDEHLVGPAWAKIPRPKPLELPHMRNSSSRMAVLRGQRRVHSRRVVMR